MKWELLEGLWRSGMMKFGRFSLASGRESPYYIDLRPLPSNPRLFSLAISEFEAMLSIRSGGTFGIASPELAGIALGAALALKIGKPFIYVRKQRKEHGTGGLVEGTINAGDRFMIVDDVLTTAGSILHVVKSLRDTGAFVDSASVLFDRMEGGRENLSAEGVMLSASTTIVEAINELNSRGLMTANQLESVLSYLRAAGASV